MQTVHSNVLITMVMIRNRLLLIAKIRCFCHHYQWTTDKIFENDITSVKRYRNNSSSTKLRKYSKEREREIIVSDYIHIRAIVCACPFIAILDFTDTERPKTVEKKNEKKKKCERRARGERASVLEL